MRKLWAHIAPHLPQPRDDAETLATLHLARTESEAVKESYRLYSHHWLRERGYPSRLPDHLKAKAERMYPVMVRAVGISVNTTSPLLKPAMLEVRTAMEQAVLDIHADDPNLSDDALVKRRIEEAKQQTIKRLLG